MILPESFYEAETKYNYEITTDIKKVWAVELDLLEKFISVCEKHDLNYFLDGGTLLGAVRHKGFIPWDDDIDVIMPRKDYNKLFEIAQDEFTFPYFFQSTLSEEGFFRTHAQLRNSNTTGFIEIDGQKPNINKGIFIDIFVLDNIPNGSFARKIFRYNITIKKKILAFQYDRVYENQKLLSKIFYKLVHLFFKVYPFKKFFDMFNRKTLGKYENRKTALVGDITLKWRENVQWPREWYEGYTYLTFEGIKVRVPLFYKNILEKQYGNYMKIPNNMNSANGRSHGTLTLDAETPYKEYFKNKATEGEQA